MAEALEEKIRLLEMKVVHRDEEIQSLKRAFEPAEQITSVEAFAAAVRRLAADTREFERLSAGALERASELTWKAKARHIAAVYNRVIAASAQPDQAGIESPGLAPQRGASR